MQFVCLLLVYILATSKVISARSLTCVSVSDRCFFSFFFSVPVILVDRFVHLTKEVDTITNDSMPIIKISFFPHDHCAYKLVFISVVLHMKNGGSRSTILMR